MVMQMRKNAKKRGANNVVFKSKKQGFKPCGQREAKERRPQKLVPKTDADSFGKTEHLFGTGKAKDFANDKPF